MKYATLAIYKGADATKKQRPEFLFVEHNRSSERLTTKFKFSTSI